MLNLFFGGSSSNFNDNNQDFTLNIEVFNIGGLGKPVVNGTGELGLSELFTEVEKSVVQIMSVEVLI